ncbi:kinase-like protein [Eremomyces bilateralis CBS 781.70]|uniref:Kinase-like protein n=1 Tax=Eremomyces bilateralis CBS 781.70 TaxID=1392243 RepID=A0A6G1G1F2_9PEZI|nr:kinase-like protein [Eremomyces bilateralis CBS 781.70]KAF1811848.1 kinase-like protein [Eremomyces bilateralis CBS 781.70]
MSFFEQPTSLPPHSSHPDFGHLVLLVFEAVLEVVCVSLPGYIIARQGMFDGTAQKFLANLNVQLFTPCLIFTKLASQLTAHKLVELGIIPFIFVIQTAVSYICAYVISKLFRFQKRPRNFVIAMGVFGNSNSLPISLVFSLAKTLSGLHWDRIPGDNDEDVAARGILYLLIFQQLGQLVRWSWGYHVLLAPPGKFERDERGQTPRIRSDYSDDDVEEQRDLLSDYSDEGFESGTQTPGANRNGYGPKPSHMHSDSEFGSGSEQSPSFPVSHFSPNGAPHLPRDYSVAHITHFPMPSSDLAKSMPSGPRGWPKRARDIVSQKCTDFSTLVASKLTNAFHSLPRPALTIFAWVYRQISRFMHGLWDFMNPPLWAMLAAIIVASVPNLQHVFFGPGTFLSNSVTRAISQSGGVAVPLILVVLGGNLARNTLPEEDPEEDPEVANAKTKEDRNLLIASLISRMLLPTIVMAPILALTAKYVPVSILDDPIFVIVCFLLTGAPSALQLAQICQINNVYMGAMSRLLFQSYVIWYSKDLDADADFSLDQPATKQYSTTLGTRRLSGRLSKERLASPRLRPFDQQLPIRGVDRDNQFHDETSKSVAAKVHEWLVAERARQRRARQSKRVAEGHMDGRTSHVKDFKGNAATPIHDEATASGGRRTSDTSEGSAALDRLQAILDRCSTHIPPVDGGLSRRTSLTRRKLLRLSRASTVSSDTDYADSDPLVPSCDAVLDNSKTLSYAGGEADDGSGLRSASRTSLQEKEGWAIFKYEIVRLTHTLRLRRWRHVPLHLSKDIDVERLSGALTNAVYVVTPPRDLLLQQLSSDGAREGQGSSVKLRKPPKKLLLRIYGPQVEHLIDRDVELAILRRLGRKNIGPKLLGTFANGRFEEYFHAQPLTPKDFRDPGTSIQIAKRMRELHEGIELEANEIAGGPFVWRNWDKWVQRCEKIVGFLDGETIKRNDDSPLVCGVPWALFRNTVDRYRDWLNHQYGGVEKVKEELIFAHNDTQYGNILRLAPSGSSPLLLPANEHRQLVVIDFEYANANVRGLEFANHFTEWCYNYHSTTASFACNTKYYPTPEEQARFIKAYIQHHPKFGGSRSNTLYRMDSNQSNASTEAGTPNSSTTETLSLAEQPAPAQRPTIGASKTTGSISGSTGSLSLLLSDSRSPAGLRLPPATSSSQSFGEVDDRDVVVDLEVKKLMHETMIWRGANSAQWVAWGVVQATIPGPEENNSKPGDAAGDEIDKDQASGSVEKDGGLESEEEEEFDYLSYARERAMFFWGDMLLLGIVREDELPENLRASVKRVAY